jgi:predicted acetyltransferase
MSLEIRTVERDELGGWLASLRVGFHQGRPEDPEAGEEDFAGLVDWSRMVGAFDGGRAVATFRSYAMSVCVPGGRQVVADAITNITVSPTHRRRGLLRQIMAADLAAAAERGEPLAILVASEWPIYGRYGFGPAADIVNYEIDARTARFAVGGSGEPRLVEPAELVDAAQRVYAEHHRTVAGAIERSEHWWRRRVGLAASPESPPGTQRCVVLDDASGVLVYHVESAWEAWRPRSVLHVSDLFATTPEAEARLWRFACEVDLVARVVAEGRAVDERLPWLLADARDVRVRSAADFLWARVLDAPAALAARGYARPGEMVLEVEDELGHAAGRFALRAGDDGAAECDATGAEADVELSVGALGAAYFGGRSLATLAAAGWARELRPGALARADAMLRTPVAPWCATLF